MCVPKRLPFQLPVCLHLSSSNIFIAHILYSLLCVFMFWLAGSLGPTRYFFIHVFDLFIGRSLPIYVLLMARSNLQQLLNHPLQTFFFAPPILPCRSRTQLDQLMPLGILQIPSPVFDNYRVWLAWASMLKVLVIYRPSSNQL